MQEVRFDVVVVGGGHNALIAASVLARAGLRVGVFEARPGVGGFAADASDASDTSDTSGASDTSAATAASPIAQDYGLLRADLIEELDLERHGLRLTARPALAALVQDGTAHGVLWADRERLDSRRTLNGGQQLNRLKSRSAGLETLLRRSPALDMVGDLVRSPELLRCLSMSASELARELLGDGEAARALALVACAWTTASPDEQGTGLQLLLQLAGSDALAAQGDEAGIRPAVGSSGLSLSLRRAFVNAGGFVRTGAKVTKITVRNGQAVGIEWQDEEGELHPVAADWVLSGVDARQTLMELIAPGHLRVDESRAVRAVRYGGQVLRLVLPIESGNSSFADLIDEQRLCGVRLYPHLDLREVSRVGGLVRRGHRVEEPWLELVVQRGGGAGASRPVQLIVHAHGIANGAPEDEVEAAVAHSVRRAERALGVRTGENYSSESSADWSLEYGATRGDGFQGRMQLEQMFALRPLAHLGRARQVSAAPLFGQAGWPTSIARLDFCGAAAHPGGYVTGISGKLAAERTLRRLEQEGKL